MSLAARCRWLVALALVPLGAPTPKAEAQTATISPEIQVVVRTDRKVFITITWCDPSRYYSSKWIRLNAVDITSQFSTRWDAAACGHPEEQQADQYYFVDTATVTLDAGVLAQTVDGQVSDGSYALGVLANYYLPDPRRGVAVTAAAQFRDVPPSTGSLVASFAVSNLGNAVDTFALVRTCSGSAISGACGSVSPGSLIVSAGGTGTATVTFTSSSTVGSTGTIGLKATTVDGSFVDSSWTGLTVKANPSGGVVIVGASPGTGGYYGRDLCLTVAVGDAAAMECGDLRLVHPLPSVRTLGRARTPTLIYNSQHARPKPLVQADVTLPTSWAGVPTTITGCIKISGASRGCTSWPGSQWGLLGQTRRVVVAGDNGPWNTGLYAYTLEITNSSGYPALTASGEFPVVNRQNSPFGAGWWLAGLEESLSGLPDGRRLVIGGDGSVRVYAPVGGWIWVEANPVRPDTLDGSGAGYIRRLSNGAQVGFTWVNGAWRHTYTRDQLGYNTYYDWNNGSSLLDSIRVPVRSGNALKYGLSYSSGLLSSVSAPGSRTTTIYRTSARVDSIADPDGNKVRFGSDSGAGQYVVIYRWDRRGKLTSFAYDTLDAVRLRFVDRPLSLRTWLWPGETRGHSQALPLDSAFAQIDGPRSDVSDVTRFWLNGYGAPTRIRNALGQETFIRYSSTWPGLPDSVVTPSRLSSRSWYNGRGLVDSVKVFDPLGTGSNATSRYTWHSVWNLVTQSTTPTGLTSSAWYSSSYPLADSTQVGSVVGRRVRYAYDSYHQLTRVAPPVVAAESLYYDNLGNVQRHRSALGLNSYSYGDALGRDTLNVAPDGNTATTWYSVMDRVDSTRSRGAAVTSPYRTHPADSVTVTNAYDAEGNPYSTVRRFIAGGATRSLTTSRYFDDANRLTGQAEAGGGTFNYSLDAAGNQIAIGTPRSHEITVTYDALNRPVRRVVPQASYAQLSCYLSPCYFMFPTRDGSNICFAADTTYLTYDAAGNLRRAENGWAWVRRGYAPNGALTHDTLVIRTYESNASDPCGGNDRHSGGWSHSYNDFTHTYASRITYDLDGRRERLYHPDAIDFCPSGQCSQKYEYSSTTGNLVRLIVERPSQSPDTALFSYDALGRVTGTRHLSGVADSVRYDPDSRVVWRQSPFSVTDTITRDALGRMTAAATGSVNAAATYGPLGALVYASTLTQGSGFEEFITDALGNRTWQRDYATRTNWPNYDDRQRTLYVDWAYARLDSIRWTGTNVPYALQGIGGRAYRAVYDAAGNVARNENIEPYYTSSWQVRTDEAVSYYDAEDRLRVHNRHLGSGLYGVSEPGGVFEEYRYDALGRRILVRSRCTAAATDDYCRGYIERTVWDGDQSLYEIRAPGKDSTAASVLENDNWGAGSPPAAYDYLLGRVGYVHAGGIDQPPGVYRINSPGQSSPVGVAPHANLLGDYATGSWITGSYEGNETSGCTPTYSGCPPITWTGGNTTMDGQLTGGVSLQNWFGNVLSGRSDGSTLQFMRNRYYDPKTGRFTQIDPIGLGGGLNLYGFASGDPVSFDDPFGLECKPPNSPLCQLVNGVVERTRAATRIVEAVWTVESFFAPGGGSSRPLNLVDRGARVTANRAAGPCS